MSAQAAGDVAGYPKRADMQRGLDAGAVRELMVGGIDVHIHTNPHVFPLAHSQDVIGLATDAHAAGMRALVIKDIGPSTTGTAYVASRLGPGIPVYGAHVMNLASGGINPRAVWVALTHGDGARVVHFPTGDTLNHHDYRKRFYAGVNLPLEEEEAVTVTRDGRLKQEVRDVIALVKEFDACLATCHISAEESHLVVREARDQGLKRIILSHSQWAMTRLTMADVKELAELGCLVEFDFGLMMPYMHFVHGETPKDPREIAAAMKEIGPERCFISSDLGQLYSPLPVEGMRTYIAILLKVGITPDEIRRMFHHNPARIVGFEGW
ncbi:DUF6282 family protein [uncultured Enterovirga sp.]|uniref:DUF6282 family protein n=1 Tax=uncultured Enterovirga sp. TaxID=2026352 RepID=UPI0035C9C417